MDGDEVRYHILTLHIGDRFRFVPGGPVFARVKGPDDALWVAGEDGVAAKPHRMQGYTSCFVYLVEMARPDDEDLFP